ncbi:MAG: aspartate aminotransferase family protein [Candidatus Latescibacterota bacterium]|nr:aspartate aminotransferase family protein [Candidatus Latescibacterota bacterium]
MSRLFKRDQTFDYPVIERGDGIYLFDTEGRRYIDGTSGAGNVTLGHGRQRIAQVMAQQAGELAYCFSSAFTNRPAMALAERVVASSPPGLNHAYFVSGGSEGVETALKLARQYHLLRGNAGKQVVIARWRGYHGGSLGAVSATGVPSLRDPFEPWLAPFPHISPCYPNRCEAPGCQGTCDLSCARELEEAILAAGPESVAAFIAEPVVMAGMAAVPAAEGYFQEVRRICDAYDVLFIADEVITGYGRTGKHFAIEHWDTTPDLLVFGKGASSGYVPLGGVLVSDQMADTFAQKQAFFAHIFTYVNNPVSAAVGLEVLDIMEEEQIVEHSERVGALALGRARKLQQHGCVGEVRGKGLLLGMELLLDPATKTPFDPGHQVSRRATKLCLERGLSIVGMTAKDWDGGDDIRFYPPLTIEPKQVEESIEIIDDVIGLLSKEFC